MLARNLTKLASKFNSPESIILISSFPTLKSRSNTNNNFNAVGWHVEKTAREIAKHRPVVIFAEVSSSSPQVELISKNLAVVRIWKKGNVSSFAHIVKAAKKFSEVRSIYVSFEFNLFGGTIPNIALLFILSALRAINKRITFEFHQVILDISQVKKHINIKNPVKIAFLNLSLKAYYTAIGLISSSVIVFEQELKERLARFVSRNKIKVLALTIEKLKIPTQIQAQAKLGSDQNKLNVLVFGFINGYKGIPWIMQLFDHKKPENMHLTIAGGKNPYLKEMSFYQKFYASVADFARNKANITHTGFIPDAKVSQYFAAADVVVMPYEAFMSASGPFSLAISYKKPLLLSDKLRPYLSSPDMRSALKKARLEADDIFFSLENEDLLNKLGRVQKSPQYAKKLLKFSEELAAGRSIARIVRQLDSVLAQNAKIARRSSIIPLRFKKKLLAGV